MNDQPTSRRENGLVASATPSSMTGFARTEGAIDGLSWIWEARSVNGKSLDVRCRLGSGFEMLEPLVRSEVARRFKRGNVTINLSVDRAHVGPRIRLNHEVLAAILEVAREVEERAGVAQRLDALLSVRGVLDVEEGGDPALQDEAGEGIERSLGELLDRLAAARREEGARLSEILSAQIRHIEQLIGDAAAAAALRPEAIRQRMDAAIQQILQSGAGVPEERLAQELAILLAKADVREELDRLAAHVAQARDLLADGAGVGRRLDFLAQEFNREANTLCSKSSDVLLTRIGLDLKAVIEQFREQIQNIE